MDFGSEMMEKYPQKKDLIFIGIDDCLIENEDGDERLDKMCEWFKQICKDTSTITCSVEDNEKNNISHS